MNTPLIGGPSCFINDDIRFVESVDDIWATLDEDIQATAREVTRKAESTKKPTKVSTGCGTSRKSVSVERQEVEPKKTQAREIGTSPPPQTISTQVGLYVPIRFSTSSPHFLYPTNCIICTVIL